jgi:hypothetical protein
MYGRSWPSRRELNTEIFEYIEAFYNRIRRPRDARDALALDFENGTLREHATSLAALRLAPNQTEIINT